MPLIDPPAYQPPWGLRNPHFNTIYPNRFRKVTGVNYQRERILTPDGDFLDLDWDRRGNDTLLLVVHGLEGNAHRYYIKGLLRAGFSKGWDGVGLNLRGCSGVPNQTYGSYHSGKSDDLHTALLHILNKHQYTNILIAGISLGGNLVLKYAGERGAELHTKVRAVAGISVPTDLQGSALQLEVPGNRIYLYRFLRQLRKKVRQKAAQFPEANLDFKALERAKNFREFDDLYTAPAHGFSSAADYYERCSANRFIGGIDRPALLLNAQDDSFLSAGCYPKAQAVDHPKFHFMMPRFGGHVGFMRGYRSANPSLQEVVVPEFFERQLQV